MDFFKEYFSDHKFETIVTKDLLDYLNKNLLIDINDRKNKYNGFSNQVYPKKLILN